jgi:5'-nucleotidase
MAGVLGAFGDPPDVVASGVNLGPNTGHSILHSGTVGAALTAQNFGASGLAVSVADGPRWWTETAGEFAVEVLRWLADALRRTALNLNVPARPTGEVLPLRWATLDQSGRCGRPPSPWPAVCSSNFGTPAPTSTRRATPPFSPRATPR